MNIHIYGVYKKWWGHTKLLLLFNQFKHPFNITVRFFIQITNSSDNSIQIFLVHYPHLDVLQILCYDFLFKERQVIQAASYYPKEVMQVKRPWLWHAIHKSQQGSEEVYEAIDKYSTTKPYSGPRKSWNKKITMHQTFSLWHSSSRTLAPTA